MFTYELKYNKLVSRYDCIWIDMSWNPPTYWVNCQMRGILWEAHLLHCRTVVINWFAEYFEKAVRQWWMLLGYGINLYLQIDMMLSYHLWSYASKSPYQLLYTILKAETCPYSRTCVFQSITLGPQVGVFACVMQKSYYTLYF